MTSPTHITAKQIYQELLDKIGSAYLRADFEYFREVIHTPHHFVTYDGKHIVDDEDGLRRAFDNFRKYMVINGLTDFVRTCTHGHFVSSSEIQGKHDSHMVKGANWIREPYKVQSNLKLTDGLWKVCSSENEVDDRSWPSLAIQQGAQRPSTTEDQKNAEN